MTKFEVIEHSDFHGQWHAEKINPDTGEVEVVIFAGAQAESRARQYAYTRNLQYNGLTVVDPETAPASSPNTPVEAKAKT